MRPMASRDASTARGSGFAMERATAGCPWNVCGRILDVLIAMLRPLDLHKRTWMDRQLIRCLLARAVSLALHATNALPLSGRSCLDQGSLELEMGDAGMELGMDCLLGMEDAGMEQEMDCLLEMEDAEDLEVGTALD